MAAEESDMQWKKIVRGLLTLALVATLTLGLDACKSLRFSKSSHGEQAATAPAEATESERTAKGDDTAGLVQAYSLCTDCLLTNDRGEAIHGAPEAVRGALESVTVFDDKAQFKGWAADIGAGGPVKAVLIFADNKLVHMGPAEEERYDVAQALGDGAGIRSGFSVVLPKALFVNGGGKGDAAIRLFALTQAGAAAELPFEQSQ